MESMAWSSMDTVWYVFKRFLIIKHTVTLTHLAYIYEDEGNSDILILH